MVPNSFKRLKKYIIEHEERWYRWLDLSQRPCQIKIYCKMYVLIKMNSWLPIILGCVGEHHIQEVKTEINCLRQKLSLTSWHQDKRLGSPNKALSNYLENMEVLRGVSREHF